MRVLEIWAQEVRRSVPLKAEEPTPTPGVFAKEAAND